MQNINSAVETLIQSSNTYFLLIGAIMVFAMHAGFAFLEVGTVRTKNQVNALVKIITDFAISCIAYFFIGFYIAYDTTFFSSASELASNNGYDLVKFFFLMTFAAAIPAIISGGIAERARFYPFLIASALIVGVVYPVFEGIVWNGNWGFQAWLEKTTGASFHDFAGSVVVHGVGGWLALVAVYFLGIRNGRLVAFAPSNIPFLALGTWILCIGWFGFNVMSAQSMDGISGLVAMNSLMAMVGGIIAALWAGKNDPGFIHNGPLAGLVAVCAGSDVMHPIGSLFVGIIAGFIFVYLFTKMQQSRKIDDVLGVWPLHGVCGAWGGIAAGIFGLETLGGLGGVSVVAQIIGTLAGITVALVGGVIVYGLVSKLCKIRLSEDEEFQGADISIHKIGSTNTE
jgi:Amt family ammonium transporter